MAAKVGCLVACLTLLLGVACVAPAYNESQYHSKVAATADDAVSVIETVRLAIEATSRHGLPHNPIDVAISGQEDILGSVTGTFASVQPPDAATQQLRTEVLDLLDQASSHLEDARIAFRRDDVGAARAAIDGAEPIAKELDDIANRY
ncbi:MAG TPA: hypothetical protein VFK89_07300 [Actinomycetota bacterium]|nr:hypothetical protein [Actinomycetota bacterium]